MSFLGGLGRGNIGNPSFYYAITPNAGDGACPPLYLSSSGGGGASAAATENYAGDGGNGGNDGDYAINGNSFIVWENIGTIYGATS